MMNNEVIKWTLFSLVLWGMPLLSSCVYVPPVWDASDPVHSVDSIKPGVTTKEEVLQKFGEPQWKDPYYRPARYTYIGHRSLGTVLYIFPFTDIDQVGQKRWQVVIRFDENDIVESISTSERNSRHDFPSTMGQNKVNYEWLKSKEANTYCPNADLGHADAQLHVANLLYHGVITNKNLVRAWVWYSLSSQNGDIRAGEQLQLVTKELSPELLAIAQQELEAWKPGQCFYDLTPDPKE